MAPTAFAFPSEVNRIGAPRLFRNQLTLSVSVEILSAGKGFISNDVFPNSTTAWKYDSEIIPPSFSSLYKINGRWCSKPEVRFRIKLNLFLSTGTIARPGDLKLLCRLHYEAAVP